MRENKRNSREDTSGSDNKTPQSKQREEKPTRSGSGSSFDRKPAAKSADKRPSRAGDSFTDARKKKSDDRPTYTKSTRSASGERSERPERAESKRPSTREGGFKPWEGKDGEKSRAKPTYRSAPTGDRPGRSESKRPSTREGGFKPWEGKDGEKSRAKPFKERDESKGRTYVKKSEYSSTGEKPFRKEVDKTGAKSDIRPFRKRAEDSYKHKTYKTDRPTSGGSKTLKPADDGLIRLNRYIANSGICSRRKADELIEAGVIAVNGEVVSELGFKVDPSKDQIKYNGELLKREKRVYVLLNKPKDYITTTDDPQERRTVMQLVEKASKERIYPVGRLDRNTTGLLLMTNDGDLADKLSHPKNGITKIYHVELSRNLTQGDLNKIQFGLELEDGLIKPDSVSYVTGGSKKEVGIQIHSGKNRIVRRIFEYLGYDVVKLDRVVYGNLTKKDLPRGRWRYLEEHELIQIKHLIQ